MTDSGSGGVTFFSVVGSQDPHVTPEGEAGPALDLLDALIASGEAVSEVLLAWTPGVENPAWPGGYDAQRAALEEAVRERVPSVRVTAVPVKVQPNVAPDLLPVFARALDRFRHAGALRVNASSGTPQMLEALKVLRGTGWFGAGDVRLFQVDRPQYRMPGTPHWREATTPFLEETLRLGAAFAALRRFDFAGARDSFQDLAGAPLELPERQAGVQALADVADALWWLDARDVAAAREVLTDLTVHVPALDGLRTFVADAAGDPAEALIWLTWGRYDRAAAQVRVADALVWAVVLHELLVVKLAEGVGLPDGPKELTEQHLPAGLFAQLKGELAPELINARGRIKFMNLKEKLGVLRAPSLHLASVDHFDGSDPTSPLGRVREWRNLVLHQGRVPDEVDLNDVEAVVQALLLAYPWRQTWARDWAKQPDACVVSAASTQQLVDELQGWVG
ncbi:hypothetical protein [Deinococcus kurensis]|uniref:hypothetical protein n=1 Tax=Deinococcus kurensis TaxID=2662757 RepID=UPI0012D34D45|nr:hypothetical protein [Deinococcus kurensis]